MNWEAIATVAEIVGAAGVIASLLFLGFETRKNTKTARASLTKEALTDMAVLNDLVAASPEMRRVAVKSMNISTSVADFDTEEWEIIIFIGRSMFMRIEGIYTLHEQGLISDQLWQVRAAWTAGTLKFPIWGHYWEQERGNSIYTPDFIAAIDSAVAVETHAPFSPTESLQAQR